MTQISEDFYLDQTFSQLKTEDMPTNGVEFANCQFNDCDFQSMDFSGYVFDNCTFTNCNLSLIKTIHAKFIKVFINESKVEGVRFDHCDPFVIELNFNNSRLRNCNFSDLNLKKCHFENSTLVESDFYKTNLTEASFRGSILSQTVFSDCDLSKADFQGAADFTINPATNKIKKAKFSAEELIGLLRHWDIVIK